MLFAEVTHRLSAPLQRAMGEQLKLTIVALARGDDVLLVAGGWRARLLEEALKLAPELRGLWFTGKHPDTGEHLVAIPRIVLASQKPKFAAALWAVTLRGGPSVGVTSAIHEEVDDNPPMRWKPSRS